LLRAFRDTSADVPRRYQPLEISASIFDTIHEAPLALFHSDTPAIECQANGKFAAMVAVDRSDAKITVRRIQLLACTVHADWRRT